MANRQPASALRSLRTLFAEGTTTGLTDGQLLQRFATKRAESSESAMAAEVAFASLVDRHGPMVWGVCRRVLRDAHDAEDAFQATFLVLVRRAGSVRVDDSLGRWLYGVAHRVARRARFDAQRREARPDFSQAAAPADPAISSERRELGDALNEEVDRLPLKYRCPIELCYLQGMTYDQAARQLAWPPATVKSRLARGRLRLRRNLIRRGLAPSVLATIALEARAAVPPKLMRSTVRAAASSAVGVFPSAVAYLSQGVLKMMAWERIGLATAGAVVALGLTAAGMTQLPSKPRVPSAEPPLLATQRSETTSKIPEADPRWTKTLPNGATIEVVGVSPYPSGPDTWRRPDGTPLKQAPCDPFTNTTTTDAPTVIRVIAVRISNLPEGADLDWGINASGSQGEAYRGGKPVADLRVATALFPKDTKTCTIRFQVAAGPWKTIQEWGTGSGGRSARNGPSFLFSGAIETNKGTVLSVTHNIQNQPVRIMAVDRKGKEHLAKFRSDAGVGDFHQRVVEFDLPPEQIKEFRVQSREYETIEVPDVKLEPAGPA
jgi:RNA polymerase sigma factor (sigma-70 family)